MEPVRKAFAENYPRVAHNEINERAEIQRDVGLQSALLKRGETFMTLMEPKNGANDTFGKALM